MVSSVSFHAPTSFRTSTWSAKSKTSIVMILCNWCLIFSVLGLLGGGVDGANTVADNHHRRLQVGLPLSNSAENRQQQDSTDHGFEVFDSNHNGVIDAEEYKQGVQKLVHLLEIAPNPSPNPLTFISSFFRESKADEEDTHNFWTSFLHSATVIIATEIGDKTFFIAAVLSMKNERFPVLLGALGALYCMTILSVMMGMILPNLLPRQYTSMLGGLLFLYFGQKLLRESRSMHDGVSGELEEVEEELLGVRPKKRCDDIESGDAKTTNVDRQNSNASSNNNSSTGNSSNNNARKSGSPLSWEKLFVQSLTLTFLAEWGDRSQIATIALASHKEPYGVTLGGCLGHTICTSIAVLGGRMLASRISEKTVAISGGVIFLVFGLHSLVFP